MPRPRPACTAVEFLFPYEHPPEAIAERLERNGLKQVLFNLPPGDWNAGEKGFAARPTSSMSSGRAFTRHRLMPWPPMSAACT